MLDRIGPVGVIRELGRGGTGIVHLARDSRLGREVAIEARPPELAGDRAHRSPGPRAAATSANQSETTRSSFVPPKSGRATKMKRSLPGKTSKFDTGG